jgi:hypothetical protein
MRQSYRGTTNGTIVVRAVGRCVKYRLIEPVDAGHAAVQERKNPADPRGMNWTAL